MKRISTNLTNNDMQYHLKVRQWKMNNLQNKLASQTRIHNLRDAPLDAGKAVRFQSYLRRMEQFQKNNNTIISRNRIAEGYLQEANNILHRIREIAILGANDTYTGEQKQYMAQEVNQLLEELVSLANARNGEGNALFSGDRIKTTPFRAVRGSIPGNHQEGITQVEYLGSIREQKVEISEGVFIKQIQAGNNIFWAEQQQIFSQLDATGYQVQQETSIEIDGQTIELERGDTIGRIIAKINDSGAPVKANLDPVKNSLVLRTTIPHQIWLQDGPDGSVLKDLGLLGPISQPPHNIADDAMVSGGSLFDTVINLRDSLNQGNTLDIGSSGIKGITLAQNNMVRVLTHLGAQNERIEEVRQRIAYEVPEVEEQNSNAVGLDLAEAITQLKMYEYSHEAALQTAGRILQPTLMDFLR